MLANFAFITVSLNERNVIIQIYLRFFSTVFRDIMYIRYIRLLPIPGLSICPRGSA